MRGRIFLRYNQRLTAALFFVLCLGVLSLWNDPCIQAQEGQPLPTFSGTGQGTAPSGSTVGQGSFPIVPLESLIIPKGMSKEIPAEKMPGEGSEAVKVEPEGLTGVKPEKKVAHKGERSEIESSLSGKIPDTISTDLSQFGYAIFRSVVSTFAPVTDVPVGPDYIVGPGDRFNISLWGRIELAYRVEVNRNGEINLPKVGALKVWGLTFSELKEYLKGEFSKHYKGFHINVVMDRLRTIKVFVVGEVATPGSYTLSSLSTVYNALFAAGGPSKRGTMRNIRLIRNSEVIRTIDLYEFLLKGDKSQDERLRSGDTIFVPIIGPVAGIAGQVIRPAIYEMKDEMTMGKLLDLAGGVTSIGYLKRVQIERIVAHERRIVEDFNLSEYPEAPQFKEITLSDRDMVKVSSIFSGVQKIVYLRGHVKQPGGYEFREGMKLLDLIPSFDQLLTEPYLDYGEIIRLIPPDFHPETLSFNLGRLLQGDPLQDIELKEYDRITLYPRESMEIPPQVTIGGEVQRPGKYRLLDNMKVKDLIYNAGNLKRTAYMEEAEITRLIKTGEDVRSEIMTINLTAVLNEEPEHNIPLTEDDYIFVRRIPKWYTNKTVTLRGEVKFPGVYSISKGERLSSVLERAGGFTEDTYLKGAFFTRESAKRVQEERIKDFADRMETDILGEEARVAEGALSEKEAASLEQSVQAKKAILMKLKTASVTGRVVIRLDSLDKFKGSKYDMELEEGDTLTIPPMPGIVNVLGSVYNPVSIVYTSGKTVNFYLNKVGGPTLDAEEDEIYIIRADGSVVSRSQKRTFGLSWDSDGKRWLSGGFMSARIDPGDTILVPTKITRFVWKKELMDWTQFFYQIAVSAGVIIAAY